jgi:hypothetical protein
MPNSAAAFSTLVTPAALFRLLIRDFSSTTINHSKLWHRYERKWTGPLVNCLIDMNFSLFLKPDVVLDLGLRLGQSLVCNTGYRGKADFWPIKVLFNIYLTNPGGS